MPPPQLLLDLQQTLTDPRADVKKRASAQWTEHIRMIMHADTAASDPTSKALRETLEWLQQTFLRSTHEKNRRLGVQLLKELVKEKPQPFRVPDEIVRYIVDIHLQLLGDKNEDVKAASLDSLKSMVITMRSMVYLCFPSILKQLIKYMPHYIGNEKDQALQKTLSCMEDLTRSMLNVVQQQLQAANAPPFDIDKFIEVVRFALKRYSQNPTVCAFVTSSCVKAFRELEHVFIIEYLHEYLQELLELINASNTATGAQASTALADTLPFVQTAFRGRLQALASGATPLPTADRVKCMIAVLNVMQPELGGKSTRTCLQWMAALTQDADEAAEIDLLPLLSRMARCVVPLCGDGSSSLGRDAVKQNERLCVLLAKYGSDPQHRPQISFADLLTFLRETLDTTTTRMTALNWITLVHERHPQVCDEMIHGLNQDVLKCISDGNEQVARKALEVLCCLARDDATRWEGFVRQLLDLISETRQQLAARIPMVIKQLQVQSTAAGFAADFVMCTLARLLAQHSDRYFVTSVVTTLSMMLITAPELTPLRHVLKPGVRHNAASCVTFFTLYRCWAYSAVWALALCLLAREYEQAHRIVTYMADCDPSAHTLMQLDRLLQLIETPAFAFLRNALTTPQRYPYLVRTLYSVLMILPQSSPQFAPLETRLRCAAQLQATLTASDAPQGPPGDDESGLFAEFLQAQENLAVAEAPRATTGPATSGVYTTSSAGAA